MGWDFVRNERTGIERVVVYRFGLIMNLCSVIYDELLLLNCVLCIGSWLMIELGLEMDISGFLFKMKMMMNKDANEEYW